MTLSAGTSIGPYEVISPVGAGGMGEVYRARDPRIGREVAIKVLPKEFAEDRVRLSRFEREARSAGSLSHPNLVTIFELGTHEGSPYIAMELLEGATLRDKLVGPRGAIGTLSGSASPIPVRKAVDFAVQIASGLAAAHEKGLVHRDIKPANIFITSSGHAKILDFGLVKPTVPFRAADTCTVTVPHEVPATTPGMVVGTAGYMSPEQVLGGEVDQRSDIFSLGVVLYEMFSGRRAFRAASSVETMNAILHEDPPALSGDGSQVPVALERIVRRCLEKEPRHRFHSAHDLMLALEAVGPSQSNTSAVVEAIAPRRRSWVPGLAIGLAIVLALLAAVAAGVAWTRSHTPAEVPVFRQLTFRQGNTTNGRFSPDGTTVYYSASWDGAPVEIFAVGRDGSNPRSLGIPGAELISVSRKGDLAILRQDVDHRAGGTAGILARVPASGGTPRDIVDRAKSADWFPSGEDLAVVRFVDERWVLEAPAGKVIHRAEAGHGLEFCRVSPDGSRLAFIEGSGTGPKLKIIDLDGKLVRPPESIEWTSALAWAADGKSVLLAGRKRVSEGGGTITAFGIDGGDRDLYTSPGEIWLYDVAPDGAILIDPGPAESSIVLIERGERERELSWLGRSRLLDLTPSGDMILFKDRTPDSKGEGSYVRRLDGSLPTYLGPDRFFALAPDGSAALAMSASDPEVLLLVPTGAGAPRPLGRWKSRRAGAFHPNGSEAIVLGTPADSPEGLYAVHLETGDVRRIEAPPLTAIGRPAPDGRFVPARDAAGGPVILDLENPSTLVPVPETTRFEAPVGWGESSSVVFVRTSTFPAELHRVDIQTGRRDPIRKLVPNHAAGYLGAGNLMLANQGKTIIYGVFRVSNSNIWVAEGIR